jgi:hypothetical protein
LRSYTGRRDPSAEAKQPGSSSDFALRGRGGSDGVVGEVSALGLGGGTALTGGTAVASSWAVGLPAPVPFAIRLGSISNTTPPTIAQREMTFGVARAGRLDAYEIAEYAANSSQAFQASLVAIFHAPKTVHTISQVAITAIAMAVDSGTKYDESRSPAGPFKMS